MGHTSKSKWGHKWSKVGVHPRAGDWIDIVFKCRSCGKIKAKKVRLRK